MGREHGEVEKQGSQKTGSDSGSGVIVGRTAETAV